MIAVACGLLAGCAATGAVSSVPTPTPADAEAVGRIAMRAVAAAERSADIAFWQLVLTLAGTIGVVISLFWTARGVSHASEAAQAAQAQITMARDELRLAQEELRNAQDARTDASLAVERQLRAYLVPRIGKLLDLTAGKPARVSIPVHNDGQTPAQAVNVNWAIGYHDFADEVPTGGDFATDSDSLIIGAATMLDFCVNSPDALSEAEIAAITKGRACVLVRGIIEYSDVFGARRTTWFTQHFWNCEDGGSHTPVGRNEFN